MEHTRHELAKRDPLYDELKRHCDFCTKVRSFPRCVGGNGEQRSSAGQLKNQHQSPAPLGGVRSGHRVELTGGSGGMRAGDGG
jgi:hypothetical protein